MKNHEVFLFLKRVIKREKKNLFFVFCAFCLVVFVTMRMGWRKSRAEKDYIEASNAYASWVQTLDRSEKGLRELQKVVNKHPELHACYDTQIAQNLLIAKSPEKAKPFLKRSLQRVMLPYFSDYAETSFLIAKGKYQHALEKAISLKKQLEEEKETISVNLFAFNLLRIALLEQVLGHLEEEKTTWQEFISYTHWGSPEQEPPNASFAKEIEKFRSHFTLQEVSFLDYIHEREKVLNSLPN